MLDIMQQDLDGIDTDLPIKIFGVNGVGKEEGNDQATLNIDLPWLQDIRSEQVYNSWDVVYRDVIILDAKNKRQYRDNLTDNDLFEQHNYDELKDLLVELASE